MKYLVISDIHGSLAGATVIEEALNRHECTAIIGLGDFLYHGPRNDIPLDYDPKKVIEILNSYKDIIIAVRGNCDAEVDQMVLDFAITADYNELFLGKRKLFISHGHVYGLDNLPNLKEEDIFLSGHTHLPTWHKEKGVYLLNPGSISLPKGGHPNTYATLDENEFVIYTNNHEVYQSISFD